MSAQAIPGLPDRRPAPRPGPRPPPPPPPRRSGSRRLQKRPPTTDTRNALIADFLAICELDPEVESVRAPAEPARFEIGDEAIGHIADFEIVRGGSAHLVDVATDEDLLSHPLR